MAKRIAKFEKVTLNQFKKDWEDIFGLVPENIEEIYNNIKYPERATVGSAGYDFYSPVDIKLNPGETVKLPTGIKCKINTDYVLKLYPRSGLGFKFRLQLNNTVGIIDSDYYGNENNEGHIMAKITNDTNEDKVVNIACGTGFMQGIFVEYGITEDDNADGIRIGGFGSTKA